jgi:DNA-directed RNA polymerase subunit RPC12/RpoP
VRYCAGCLKRISEKKYRRRKGLPRHSLQAAGRKTLEQESTVAQACQVMATVRKRTQTALDFFHHGSESSEAALVSRRRMMGTLVYVCPTTGDEVLTGIEMRPETLESLRGETVRCPYCLQGASTSGHSSVARAADG